MGLFSFIQLQYRTDLLPIVQNSDVKDSQANYVYIMPDYHNPQLGHPVFLEITPAPDIKYKIVPSTSKGMNVLGIVIFSATMGKTKAQLRTSQKTSQNHNHYLLKYRYNPYCFLIGQCLKVVDC